MSITLDVSIGEAIDKLTILDIKMTNILDVEKLKNISKEYGYLKDVVEEDLNISTESEEYLKEMGKFLFINSSRR